MSSTLLRGEASFAAAFTNAVIFNLPPALDVGALFSDANAVVDVFSAEAVVVADVAIDVFVAAVVVAAGNSFLHSTSDAATCVAAVAVDVVAAAAILHSTSDVATCVAVAAAAVVTAAANAILHSTSDAATCVAAAAVVVVAVDTLHHIHFFFHVLIFHHQHHHHHQHLPPTEKPACLLSYGRSSIEREGKPFLFVEKKDLAATQASFGCWFSSPSLLSIMFAHPRKGKCSKKNLLRLSSCLSLALSPVRTTNGEVFH